MKLCETTPSYEKIYFSLWEISQRYHDFSQFRVIGKSHDDRLLPMVEIGTGSFCLFCISGLDGSDYLMPNYLVHMAEDYCKSYEFEWTMIEDYNTRQLLDQIKICFIPLINPDGYELHQKGYSAIRNPILRQMLRMKNNSDETPFLNARAINLRKNFPINNCCKNKIHEKPASENETKALIHLFQEYDSVGLLSFGLAEKKKISYKRNMDFIHDRRSLRTAKQLQRYTTYRLEKEKKQYFSHQIFPVLSGGSPEQFYVESIKQISLTIESAFLGECKPDMEEQRRREYQELSPLPLEYIHFIIG